MRYAPEFGMEQFAAYAAKYTAIKGSHGLGRAQLYLYLMGKIPRKRLKKHGKEKCRELIDYTNGLIVYDEDKDRLYWKGGPVHNAIRLLHSDWVLLIRTSHRKAA